MMEYPSRFSRKQIFYHSAGSSPTRNFVGGYRINSKKLVMHLSAMISARRSLNISYFSQVVVRKRNRNYRNFSGTLLEIRKQHSLLIKETKLRAGGLEKVYRCQLNMILLSKIALYASDLRLVSWAMGQRYREFSGPCGNMVVDLVFRKEKVLSQEVDITTIRGELRFLEKGSYSFQL